MLQDGSLIMYGRVNGRTGHHTTSWDVSFIDVRPRDAMLLKEEV